MNNYKRRRAILVVEGPAGSGKSTIIDLLDSVGFYPLHKTSKNVRDYQELGDAALMSQIKDIKNFARAIQLTPDEIPVMDRFILSQQVYGAIRRADNRLASPHQLITHIHEMSDLLLSDYLMRQGVHIGKAHVSPVEVYFLVLLPSVARLNYQRGTSGKEYPFSAKREIELYKKISVFEENTRKYMPPITFDVEPLEIVYKRVIRRIKNIFKHQGIEFPRTGVI
jgi:hypothetical protein